MEALLSAAAAPVHTNMAADDPAAPAQAAPALQPQARRKPARLLDVAFNPSTCVWTWTPSATRLVSDTWLQAQIRDGPSDVRGPGGVPYDSVGDYLPLNKVKALAGQNIRASGSVRGSDDRENGPASVRLPFWDHGLQQLVGGLREENEFELRLSVYGGQGQTDIGYSAWIRVRELLAIAKRAQPPTWDADLEEAEKRRQEQGVLMQQKKAEKEVEKRQKQEEDAAKEPERKRKREEREAREAEAVAAAQAEAAVAPAGTSWRSYDGSSRVGLSMFSEGWDTRDLTAQEKVEHRGATMVFRAGVKLQVSSRAICLCFWTCF